jgi:hypothetical protein
MTFAMGFTWVSETLLAFVHMAENAIHLYEFVEDPGRVKLIRALELPPLCDGGRLNFAQCHSEQNPVFQPPSYPPTSRPPPRFPFRYNPADGIACFILGVGLEEIPGASMTIAIVVHRRVLVALASAAAGAGAGTGSSTDNNEQQRVPWDSWGPSATRCLEVPYWRRCSGPIGQRWGMLAQDELVLRDFNPHSVSASLRRYAAAQQQQQQQSSSSSRGTPGTRRGAPVLRHENGNRTRVVTAPTLLTAGLCFRGDVISHLPYIETRAMCTPRWESVLMDGERLLSLYFKEVSRGDILLPTPWGAGLISISPFAAGGRCRHTQGCYRHLSYGPRSLVDFITELLLPPMIAAATRTRHYLRSAEMERRVFHPSYLETIEGHDSILLYH